MLKKKRNLLFASCLVGLLATTSAATVALSSCSTSTTNSSSSNSSNDVQYSYVIDWNNEDAVKRLIIDNNGFVYSDNTMSTIIAVSPKVKLTTVKIPSSVKSIMGYSKVMYKDSTTGTLYDQIPSGGTASNYIKVYQSYGAFQGMESLETVALEAGTQLQSIGGAAFSNCINLQNITNLSSSLEYIGVSAFNNCANLQAIDISNVVKVDNYAFSGCTNLKNIAGSSQNLKYIGAYAFNGCSNLEQVDISSTISVGDYAFNGCTILKDVSGASKNLLYIGVGSFYNCASLQEIDISNVANINNYAFYGCTGLSSIDLSNALVIGEYAFQNCSSLTSLGSLEKVTTMGQYAFSGATKSGANISIKLGKLSALPNYAFYGALGLSTVDFSNNTLITAINTSSFTNSSIKEINLGGCSGLTTIGDNAFNGCTSLTNVYLPSNDVSNLTSIGSGAFLNCSSLSIVGVKGTATSNSFVATEKLSKLGANFLAKTPITSVDLTSFKPNNSTEYPLGSMTSLAYISGLTSVKLPATLTKLNVGLFYGSGIGANGGFAATLPSTITSIVYSASSTVVNEDNTGTQIVKNITPFTNSGVTSVDMSNITSYQLGSKTKTSLPKYLFNDATKLTSVVLKDDTTAIEAYAFAGTTALTSITYPSSSTDNTIVGFKAPSNLTTIDDKAFDNAFSKTANITFDLSQMKFESTPTAFDNSNIVNLILPTTTKTIAANSFNNTPKLASVNFKDLTNLTSIVAPNFNNNKLTSIDLSNVNVTASNFNNLFSNVSDTNKLFTGLPATCVVSLPATIGKFNESVFLDTNGKAVTFSYPNGILLLTGNDGIGQVSSNVFSFVNPSDPRITNIKEINMSNIDSIRSIGPNTFFGNSRLSSITLKAKGISGGKTTDNRVGLFSTTTNITGNNSNTTKPTDYENSKIPFGNNASLTSLNYTGFTLKTSNTGTIAIDSNSVSNLFNTTNEVTWAEIAKIISSLSFQSTTGANASAIVKANMYEWNKDGYNGGNNPTNPDIVNEKDPTTGDMVLKDLYHSTSELTGNAIHFKATDTQKTFYHNGAKWTYTNDGSTIKFVGAVNMYKLTSSNNKQYLTYFNQLIDSPAGSSTSYYIPGATINVTLTVATAASSTTK